jgi:hypothetical protein
VAFRSLEPKCPRGRWVPSWGPNASAAWLRFQLVLQPLLSPVLLTAGLGLRQAGVHSAPGPSAGAAALIREQNQCCHVLIQISLVLLCRRAGMGRVNSSEEGLFTTNPELSHLSAVDT